LLDFWALETDSEEEIDRKTTKNKKNRVPTRWRRRTGRPTTAGTPTYLRRRDESEEREEREDGEEGRKREKDNEKMRDFFRHSLYIGSRYPTRVGAWFYCAPSSPMRFDQDQRAPDALVLDQIRAI